MRIVVDVSPLSDPLTGIGNYIRGSLAGLVAAAGDRHEVVAFAPTKPSGVRRIREALAGIPVETRLIPFPMTGGVRRLWSESGRLSVERLAGPLDAFLFSEWMYPAQRGGIRATVFHDLIPIHHPEWCTQRTVAMHTKKAHHAARTCDVVVANSEFTANDVVETLGIPRERVTVAPPGVDGTLGADGPRADFGGPAILALGTLEPRKNLARLVEAWRELLSDELGLVLAGRVGWGDQRGLDDPRVRRLGFVPAHELSRIYRGASVFVYPSLFEGFGMPIVEAMASGVPVVASAHPSMNEACGDAAIRVDPSDPRAIADGVREAIARRGELVPRGLAHARRFTWEANGRAVLAALEARTARDGNGCAGASGARKRFRLA